MQTSNAWVIVCMCLKHVEVWVKGGAGEYERDLLWTSSGGLTCLQGLGVRAKIKRKWATVCSFQEKPGVYVPVHRLEMINCTDSTWHTWSCKARKSKINWDLIFYIQRGVGGVICPTFIIGSARMASFESKMIKMHQFSSPAYVCHLTQRKILKSPSLWNSKVINMKDYKLVELFHLIKLDYMHMRQWLW